VLSCLDNEDNLCEISGSQGGEYEDEIMSVSVLTAYFWAKMRLIVDELADSLLGNEGTLLRNSDAHCLDT
jgi:hypothetical protein